MREFLPCLAHVQSEEDVKRLRSEGYCVSSTLEQFKKEHPQYNPDNIYFLYDVYTQIYYQDREHYEKQFQGRQLDRNTFYYFDKEKFNFYVMPERENEGLVDIMQDPKYKNAKHFTTIGLDETKHLLLYLCEVIDSEIETFHSWSLETELNVKETLMKTMVSAVVGSCSHDDFNCIRNDTKEKLLLAQRSVSSEIEAKLGDKTTVYAWISDTPDKCFVWETKPMKSATEGTKLYSAKIKKSDILYASSFNNFESIAVFVDPAKLKKITLEK